MFGEIFGNEAAKRHARHLLATGRLPHSFLLAGPEGIGKRLFALELARAFACTAPSGLEACGNCSACVRSRNFRIPKSADKNDDFKKVFFSEHPDVGTVVAYKQSILIDAIRDLEREANFRPYESRARFFIIDDAERLNDSSANALLKTLEEPSDSTYLILVSSRPDSLLPTIRSRCQMLRFTPVSVEDITRCIEDRSIFQGEEARLVARLVNGSIGTAVSFDLPKFRELREAMFYVINSGVIGRDIAGLVQAAERMTDAKGKEDYEASLDVLELLVRDIWLIKNGSGAEGVVNIDIAHELSGLAASVLNRDLREWLVAIEQLRRNFASNINKKVATDSLFLQMAGV